MTVDRPDTSGERVERFRAATAGAEIEEFLSAAVLEFRGRLLFATSLGAEDQVLTHLLSRLAPEIFIITLDTGRLPQETYDLIDETRLSLGVEIEVLFPHTASVETLVRAHGVNLFYESIEKRKACCFARKVEPLRRKLAGFDAWMTGMRRDQSPTRSEVERIEVDPANGMVKLNPLVEWSRERVWSYLRAEGVPYNRLHDRGFPSIGCLPCTRAVAPGEDERAGRWWWERPEQKECGIHIVDGKVVRAGVTEKQNG
ncbi:MAG TPA: phosphoadenylyl-sulfate reductase [Spirochaetia bacterium]|nr:phosphoadenylyl-sulfate reductase [Spirochaetia bacterium]